MVKLFYWMKLTSAVSKDTQITVIREKKNAGYSSFVLPNVNAASICNIKL